MFDNYNYVYSIFKSESSQIRLSALAVRNCARLDCLHGAACAHRQAFTGSQVQINCLFLIFHVCNVNISMVKLNPFIAVVGRHEKYLPGLTYTLPVLVFRQFSEVHGSIFRGAWVNFQRCMGQFSEVTGALNAPFVVRAGKV